MQGVVGDVHLRRLEAVADHLPRQQVVAGDGDLLVLGVAVERDELQAVQQRPGDRLEHVGRGDEEHIGEVEVDLEVVVAERVVLRRVEDLEQRGRRIAAPVAADLVDLVEEHDGVHRAGLGDGSDDATGLRPDVGAAMAADLRLVAHAAEGDPHEAATEGAGDRLAQRGLADARRADQREDGAGLAASGADLFDAALLPQLAHREQLHDPLLHLVEAGVVGIERGARRVDVELVGGALGPRETEDRVEPTLDPPALHVLLGHALEPAELLAQRPHHLVGDPGGFEGVDAVAVVVHGLAVVLVAELLADGLHLPAQDVLALLLVEPVADLMADLVGQLPLRQRVLRPAEHEPHPLGDVDRLEQLDLLLGRQLGPPPDQVGEAAGVVGIDAPQDAADLPVAEVLEQRDQRGPQLGAQRLGLVGGRRLHDGLGRHPQAGPGADHAGAQPGSAGGAHDEGGGATRQDAGRLDRGDRADLGEPVTDAGDEQQLAALVRRPRRRPWPRRTRR